MTKTNLRITTETTLSGTTITKKYDGNNMMEKINGRNTWTYEYDERGNQTKKVLSINGRKRTTELTKYNNDNQVIWERLPNSLENTYSYSSDRYGNIHEYINGKERFASW